MKANAVVFSLALVMFTAVGTQAGDLNVQGNMSVSSNLTAHAISLGGESRTNWPTGAPAGVITNGQTTSIRLNGGLDVRGGTLHANEMMYVDIDLWVGGKVYADGGIDPPYLLLDAQVRTALVARVALEVPPEKRAGAALFFNSATKKLEIYVPSDGKVYDLTGTTVATVPAAPPGKEYVTRYRIDPQSGEVKTYQLATAQRFCVKPGYVFDDIIGKFYSTQTDPATKIQSLVEVPKSEALTIKQADPGTLP